MLDSWFTPTGGSGGPTVERSPEQQARVDAETASLALYHYESCMFCARVRRAIARLKLNIELRDILRDAGHRRDLEAGGGRSTVPCMKIGEGQNATWMYESADIVAWLEKKFGGSGDAAS